MKAKEHHFEHLLN